MSAAMGPIDRDAAREFWERAVASGAVSAGPLPEPIEQFGADREQADELLALVVDGPKRATAGAVAQFEHDGTPLPEVGSLWVVADGAGRARAVLRTTDVRVGPLSSVDDRFAWDEGEGDRTRAWWLAAHERFFRTVLPAIGVKFTPDLPTVFERFEVVYAESADAEPRDDPA